MEPTAKKYGITLEGNYGKLPLSADCVKFLKMKIDEETKNGVKFRQNALAEFCFILNLTKHRSKIKKMAIRSELTYCITSANNELKIILDSLTNWGLLKINHHYKVGTFGKAFEVVGLAAENGFYSFPLDHGLLKILSNIKKKDLKEAHKYNRLDGLTFDSSFDAVGWFNEYKRINPIENESELISILTAINDIQKGNLRISKHKNKEGRLYSCLTSLKSELRKYLRVYGKILLEIDIKSSQPRILADVFLTKLLPILLKDNKLSDIIYQEMTYANTYSTCTKDEVISKLTLQLEDFKELASEDIYSTIATEIGLTREEVKQAFIVYFNDYHFSWHIGKSKNKEQIPFIEKIHEWFGLRFTLIQIFIWQLHKIENGMNDGVKHYSSNAMEFSIWKNLAFYESELIGEISKAFIRSCDGFLGTIHDSFLVEPEHLDLLLGLMESTYKSRNIKLKYTIEELVATKLPPPQYILSPYVVSSPPNTPVIPTNQKSLSRHKATKIRLKPDGRYAVSIKERDVLSRKGESLEAYTARVIGLGAILTGLGGPTSPDLPPTLHPAPPRPSNDL